MMTPNGRKEVGSIDLGKETGLVEYEYVQDSQGYGVSWSHKKVFKSLDCENDLYDLRIIIDTIYFNKQMEHKYP